MVRNVISKDDYRMKGVGFFYHRCNISNACSRKLCTKTRKLFTLD
jgi:hypothetical protein